MVVVDPAIRLPISYVLNRGTQVVLLGVDRQTGAPIGYAVDVTDRSVTRLTLSEIGTEFAFECGPIAWIDRDDGSGRHGQASADRRGLSFNHEGSRVFVAGGCLFLGDEADVEPDVLGVTADDEIGWRFGRLLDAEEEGKVAPKATFNQPQVVTPGRWTVDAAGNAYRCLHRGFNLMVTKHTPDNLEGVVVVTVPGVYSKGDFLDVSPDGREVMLDLRSAPGIPKSTLARVDVRANLIIAEYEVFADWHDTWTTSMGAYSEDGATFACLASRDFGSARSTWQHRLVVMDVG